MLLGQLHTVGNHCGEHPSAVGVIKKNRFAKAEAAEVLHLLNVHR
jgi:hypothetical protein